MIVKIDKIEKDKRFHLFETSDKQQFHDKDEAEWHELVVCKLNQRRIKFELPDHSIYTFIDQFDIQEFLKEGYGHLQYKVEQPIETLPVPNNYVVTETEIIENGKTTHIISFQSLETFKRNLVNEILSM